MIGTFEIRCYAANPQMPLPPMFAFKDSPSSLRLLEIPKKIGQWSITTVKVAVNYPDNITHIYDATRIGNVWVVTFNGCSITGKVANGLEVLADGTDENGDTVNGYVLGVGDIYILDRDADVEEAVSKSTLKYCDVMPETPVTGDVFIGSDAVEIYNGTQWISIDIDLSEYATKSEVETTASTLDDKIDSTKTELESSIAEVASDIPTYTSELTNDSGFITSANVPTKTSDLTNDSGFITSVSWSEVQNKPSIPTKTSDLVNDSGFITSSDIPAIPTKTSDLTNDSDFTTNTALNAGLALKQDKLSNTQVSAINSVVDERATVVKYNDNSVVTYNIEGTLSQNDIAVTEKEIVEVKVGTTVTGIPNYGFQNCDYLTTFTMPDTVTTIGQNAFNACSRLVNIKMSNNITLIDSNTFLGCTGLVNIVLPEKLVELGSNVFTSCSGITEVVVPKSITSLGATPFYGCTSLTSVTFVEKTLAQVQALPLYPWGLNTSIIKTYNVASKEWVLEQIAALRAELQGGN